ncbi:hypothetical protein DSM104299_05269 [Baekduia alba]|nr:hypothetical protein DSM104299_05269 [Baekduia alba]
MVGSTHDRDALLWLLDELLEAHLDTVEMILGGQSDADWTSHAEYLKGLQRLGRATIARACAQRS